MSQQLWHEIVRRVHDSQADHQVERTADRVGLTAEIFTPAELVGRLLSSLPPDALSPGRLVLDPACGDGQFLLAVKLAKMLIWGMTEEDALAEIYGVDIIAENVAICRQRLGGGFIAVGNALRPEELVEGQTDSDRRLLEHIFGAAEPTLFSTNPSGLNGGWGEQSRR